jgi:predicted O-linked N-acetylglucosamine transferase (SPINDLY family)
MDKALAEKATLERFELGRSISAILANPDNYQTGLVPVPRTQPPLKFNYPPGVEVSPPSPEAMQLLNDGDFAKADRLLDDRNVLHLFAKLKLPAMHASNEQIAESRVRFADALNKIGELKFDPRAGVAGLVSRQSYDLAYQGLSVRALLERQGEVFAKIAASATPGLVEPLRSNRKPGKTRIGYISNNMRFSNGCRWSLGWLANHGEEFESYAFNTGPQEDVVSQQFKATADHYYRITGGYAEAAKFIRALDLDIMIFTDIGLVVGDYAFATLRLARIQCTAWGHPVTSGLPTIDYYLSSELMEPEGAESEYSENLVRLPNSGLYIKRPAYDVPKATREQLGLPEGFLPFMSQAILKWIPNRDEVLARIYERLQAPLVFVGSAYAAGDAKFSARLDKLGIKSRILPRTHPQQFNRYVQAADVCFDPPDWSGGNTTIEALWAGVPVVTWPGLYMRGRHSLAFNEIAGISELNATSEADFVGHIFDRDLHAEAMKKCNRDSLFEDKVASNGLNNFLLNVVRV